MDMKLERYILRFAAAAALLAATSCVEPISKDSLAGDDSRPRVTVTLDVPVDAATKGPAGTNPSISSVWVAEFSASGWFRSWTQAVPVSGHISGTGTSAAKTYTVSLPVSDTEQRFHIVADPPHTNSMTGMSEEEALSSMYTTGGQECFWQRVVVPGGVRGTVVAGEFVATAATQAAFTGLSLVRNTVRINVVSSSASTVVQRYALVNAPGRGYAAPLDMASLSFFPAYMAPATLAFDDVEASYVPRNVEVDVTTDASALTFTNAGTPLFCYERPVPTANPTAVLVGTNRGWYKIEILHGLRYVPLLRNFTYTVDLSTIDFAGEATAQAALDGPALGDVSANLETAALTTISTGGHTLTVGFTDYTSTSTSATTAQLSYSFTPASGTVRVEVIDPGSGAVTASSFSVTGSSGSIDVPLAGAGGSMKKSVIRVTGKATEDSRELYRNVTFRVMGRQELGGGITTSSRAKGGDVKLTIGLSEDLGRSLFPLTIHIEADDNSLTSEDVHLSAESGASLFDSSKRSFHYVKTIIYTDYYDLATKRYTTSFDVDFKRNMTLASGAAATTVRLADADGRFISHDITLP